MNPPLQSAESRLQNLQWSQTGIVQYGNNNADAVDSWNETPTYPTQDVDPSDATKLIKAPQAQE